ncbi:MAG: MBL fold metallo-hydrolase [Candidatus Neomarinimicrobiota bacterium]
MRKNINKLNSTFSIQSFEGGYDKNFSYILTCLKTNDSIIIDASVHPSILNLSQKNKPSAIFITHSHTDHVKYIKSFKNRYPGIKIVGHPESKLNTRENNYFPSMHNYTIKVGKLNIKTLHTPGHYFDSVCFHLENIIFTGDTMFVGRTGRTVSNGSNVGDLYNSIYKNILSLPQNTIIYPGHNYGEVPSISIQKNIEISPLLQASDKNDFVNKMKDYEKNR